MNRIERVLSTIGYTLENLDRVAEQCPGSFIDEFPKSGRKDCDEDCTKCWESEG